MTQCTMTCIAILLGIALMGMPAAAEYEINWYTIDGGGGSSSGSEFSLTGTVGQHDAGMMNAEDYDLLGGFWAVSAHVDEPCQNPADFNCDGTVDGADLLIMLSQWGACPDGSDCSADLNGDGTVDGADLLILLSQWG